MNVRELIPKDKFDVSHITDLMEINETDIQPILPDLLQWIEDINWPVASDMVRVLARFPDSVTPLLHTLLDISAKDTIAKYWIIVCLIPLFPIEKQRLLLDDVKRICNNPSDSEVHEEVVAVAEDFFHYTVCRDELRECEQDFENNPDVALIKMAELYCRLYDTTYHDLFDSIELWINHYGNRKLLDYIVENNNLKMKKLQEIIESKSKIVRS
jgi:hypothetical protein